MITTRRLVIQGQVQGVGYRYAMMGMARRLSIKGWVRNRRDGSVEALVQGPLTAVDQLIDWARQGPDGASVRSVETFSVETAENPADFHQLPTV